MQKSVNLFLQKNRGFMVNTSEMGVGDFLHLNRIFTLFICMMTIGFRMSESAKHFLWL